MFPYTPSLRFVLQFSLYWLGVRIKLVYIDCVAVAWICHYILDFILSVEIINIFFGWYILGCGDAF